MYVFTKPRSHGQGGTQGQFLSRVWFEFRIYFLLDWLPNQG